MEYGFVKVAAAIPGVRIADCAYNMESIKSLANRADEEGAQIAVFPELCLTAYTCGDLFQQEVLILEAEKQLGMLLDETGVTGMRMVLIIGMPVRNNGRLYNCAVVIQEGRILGVVPKTHVPGREFGEERWFASGVKAADGGMLKICGRSVLFGTDILFCDENDAKICFGVELCEDLWPPIPPSSKQALAGATLLFNPSACNELVTRHEYIKSLVALQSGRCIAGYIHSSCGLGESTTDLVFGGYAAIAENGAMLVESSRFTDTGRIISCEIDVERLVNDRMKNTCFYGQQSDKHDFRKAGFRIATPRKGKFCRIIDPYPFVPEDAQKRKERCREIYDMQISGLAGRLRHTCIEKAVIAISGGLDSTLALLVTASAFDFLGYDRKNIMAITMPGFGTTDRTYQNAKKLIDAVNANVMDIDIREACMKHFNDIGHDPGVMDTTYENVQARERTQVLMDVANKIGGLVIGTGDLSEMALGWSTYNGDHMSMYSVNCGVPKTMVRHLLEWIAGNSDDEKIRDVLQSIIDTPISPELVPPSSSDNIEQRTEEIIGPYELHEFFLYHIVRYGASPSKTLFLARQAYAGKYDIDELKKWLRVFITRFFSQQFKRSCVPDGPKIGTIGFSPRGDWKMPSDACAKAWLADLDKVE